MRVDFRKIAPLAACAAIASAALAHYAIDVVGDFALAHDAYDDLHHASRGIAAGIAALIAMFLAGRGLRICCELAERRSGRITAALTRLEAVTLFVASVLCSVALVPLMEWCDGRLTGAPVDDLTSAFGGSVALGVATTACCAAVLTLCLTSLVQCKRGEIIIAMVATLLGRRDRFPWCFCGDWLLQRRRFLRRCPLHALRLWKRGPPSDALHSITHKLLQGDPCEAHFSARRACGVVARARAERCSTRRGARTTRLSWGHYRDGR
jgi:hypothetical protein